MIFSRKPAKHYFIDSENVNDVWVEGIVQSLGQKDHIYIFYSENSTHMKSDSVRRLMELGADRVTWIRCYIGTNALDFQLVTVLGAVASNGRSEDEFVIVSNDAGFDAVVSFWQDQGREVSRLKMDTSAGRAKRHAKARKPVRKFQSQKPDLRPEARPQAQPETRTQQNPRAEQPKKQQPKAEQPKKQQPKAEQPKKQQQPKAEQPKKQQPKAEQAKKQQQQPKQEKKEQPKQKKTVVQELSKRDQAILKSVCRSIPSKDAGQLHDALNTLLGAEDGMRIYNFLKKNQDEQKLLEGVLLPESGARASNYVRLIYAVAGVSEETGLTITDIYKTSRKDGLQGINLAMVKKFGQDDANKYYPDLKRHYRILEKISKN